MADHEQHESHSPTRTPAPAPSKAFPANTEPKGKTIFGPQPTPHRPAAENIFNVDKHGKRAPRDK